MPKSKGTKQTMIQVAKLQHLMAQFLAEKVEEFLADPKMERERELLSSEEAESILNSMMEVIDDKNAWGVDDLVGLSAITFLMAVGTRHEDYNDDERGEDVRGTGTD